MVPVREVDECWEWMGERRKSKWNYGKFYVKDGHYVMAHRFGYEIANGPIPEGLLACHKCDNPPCVNPNHIFLGTDQDNTTDKIKKGRILTGRGERHRSHILTEELVRKIRMDYKGEFGQITSIAKSLGVTYNSVFKVVHGYSWKHVHA